MLTALRVLEVMKDSGQSLEQLASQFTTYPQVLINVRVREKRPLDQIGGVRDAIAQAERELGDSGRINVRYSGTEPVARVMVEASTEEQVNAAAHRIADAVRAELG
jgi:phosphoglucosamine mutase